MADWSKFFGTIGETVQQTFGTVPGSVGNKLYDAEIARGNALAKRAETLETRNVDATKLDWSNNLGLHKEVLKKYLDALTKAPTMDYGGASGEALAPEIDLTELRQVYAQTYFITEAKRAVYFAAAGLKFTPVSMDDMLGEMKGSGMDFEILGGMVADSLKGEEGGASLLEYAKDIQAGKTVNLEGNIESIQKQFVDAQNAARVKEQLPHMSPAETELFLNKQFSEERLAKLKQAIRKSIMELATSGSTLGPDVFDPEEDKDRYRSDQERASLMEQLEGRRPEGWLENIVPAPLSEQPAYQEEGEPQAALGSTQGMLTQRQMIAQAEQEAIQRQSNFPQWLEMLRRRAAA